MNGQRTELYRHFDTLGRLLYVGISLNSVIRLLAHRDTSKWFDQIATITIEKFPTRNDALTAEKIAIETEQPLFNVKYGQAVRKAPGSTGIVKAAEMIGISVEAAREHLQNNTFPIRPIRGIAKSPRFAVVLIEAYLRQRDGAGL